MSGIRLYRRGLSPLQPQGRRLLSRGARSGAEARPKVAAFGMTRRRDIAAEDDHGDEGTDRRGDAGDHDRGQELGPACPRRLGGLARGKPADDRRLGCVLCVARPRGDLRRRAFLRRLEAQPRLCPADHPRGRGRRRGLDRAVRHQRRGPARGSRRGRSQVVQRAVGSRRHSYPQRRRPRRGQCPGGGPPRASQVQGTDQRPGRALRQRRPVQRGGATWPSSIPDTRCSRRGSSSI